MDIRILKDQGDSNSFAEISLNIDRVPSETSKWLIGIYLLRIGGIKMNWRDY